MSSLENKRKKREEEKKVSQLNLQKKVLAYLLPIFLFWLFCLVVNEKQTDYINYVILKGTPLLDILFPLYIIYIVIVYRFFKKRKLY